MKKLKSGDLRADGTPYTEDEIKVHNDMLEFVTKVAEQHAKGLMSQDEVDARIANATKEFAKAEQSEDLTKELDALKATIKAQSNILAQIKQNSGNSDDVDTVEAKIVSIQDEINKATETKSTYKFNVANKAVFLRTGVANNMTSMRLDGTGQLAHRKLAMYDLFPKVPISEESNGMIRYIDWDSATSIRAAAAIAENGTFPESTAIFTEFGLALQKIGDSLPISVEVTRQAARFAREVELFIVRNVDIKVDADLANGNGTAPQLRGLVTSAPTYTPVASGIFRASIYDLIVKMAEAITSTGGAKYLPTFVLMNIADINRMRLTKDVNGQYIIPPFVTADGKEISGMTIIECNTIAANTLVLGDSMYGTIYEDGNTEVEMGWVNAQFTSDMMTLKARKFLALLIRNVDASGFLKCTNITTALTTLAT
jgi:HK97 family phage major capsid protein